MKTISLEYMMKYVFYKFLYSFDSLYSFVVKKSNLYVRDIFVQRSFYDQIENRSLVKSHIL